MHSAQTRLHRGPDLNCSYSSTGLSLCFRYGSPGEAALSVRGNGAASLALYCTNPLTVAWRSVLLATRCFTRTVSLGWHHLTSVSREVLNAALEAFLNCETARELFPLWQEEPLAQSLPTGTRAISFPWSSVTLSTSVR